MAVDFHLKIDGIPGESQDSAHPDEIDVITFSWGETQTGTMAFGSGGGAGKVQMQDFHFTMYYGKASPLLFLKCANGKTIPSAAFTARKPTGDTPGDYMVINFTNLLISSYHTSGGGGDVAVDSVSFNFEKIEVKYQIQDDATGALSPAAQANFDLKKMVGGS